MAEAREESEPADGGGDAARTDGLGAAIARLMPALEEFLRFEGPDGAARRSQWRGALDVALPEEGAGAEAVLAALAEVVIPNGLRTGASGFCGWVTGGTATVPAAATLAAAIAAPQRWWVGPGNVLELVALRWLAELLDLPHRAGSLVSGGALGNLIALTAARQHAAERRGIDPAADGIAALPAPRVYAGEGVHGVVPRALAVLGLGRNALTRIPPGRRGARPPEATSQPEGAAGRGDAAGATRAARPPIDVDALRAAIDADLSAGRTPVAIVATAGDAATGAIDPIDALRAVASEHGIWLHVDAAYGGFARLDPRVRSAFGDLGAVDSIVVDPHKWLAVPVGCGAVLVRDAGCLERALALEPAPYLGITRRGPADPGSAFDEMGEGRPDHTLEHSAPARGVAVWAALLELGRRGVAARVGRHLDCARRVADRVRQSDELELLAGPTLSIVCFRYHPPHIRQSGILERLNEAILRAVRERGRVVPSATRIDSKLAIRACFLGPRTGLADADALVDEVLAAGRALAPPA
jgi:aromatic-L-amino-acid/L-tryptophan decarboxylase